MACRTTTCMSASRAAAQSTSAYLLSVRPAKGVMVGGLQSTEKIRHLSFLQLSGRRRSLNFPASRIQLTHVISTDGDTATKTAFLLGQRLGLLTWRKVSLQRQYGGKLLTFAEADLDTTTIGNFSAF